ncbi:hypothetical protein [Nostoc sp.]
MVNKKSPQVKKRGAPKGHISNPEGHNQYEGVLAGKTITVRLYEEDSELLRSLAEGKDKGFMGQFIRDAVRVALAQLTVTVGVGVGEASRREGIVKTNVETEIS